MFLGMRDVILKHMELKEPYEFLRRHKVDTLEVRIQPDLSLDCFAPSGAKLRVGSQESDLAVLESAKKAGVRIGGILLNTQYHVDNIDAESEKRWIQAAVAFAAQANVGVIRVDVVSKPLPPNDAKAADEYLAHITPRFEAHLQIAREKGIRFAVENHCGFTSRREYLSRLLDRFECYDLGVTLDTLNFYYTGGYPLSRSYAIIREFADRVTHVHLKNLAYPAEARELTGHNCSATDRQAYEKYVCPIYEGDVDHARVLKILHSAGYEGGLYVEDESLRRYSREQQVENMVHTFGYFRGILAAL
jgi:sugar phosphate isomerase/epimerase